MTLRPITNDNLDKARAFTDEWVRKDFITLRSDFFEWQFMKSSQIFDEGRDPGSWICEDDAGAVVGIYTASKNPFWLNGQRMIGAWGHDWFADKNRKGEGLPLGLRQVRENGVIAGCGLSLQAAISLHSLFPSQWFEMKRLFGVVDGRATARLMEDASQDAQSLLALFSRMRSAKNITISTVDYFNASYDEVWKDMRESVTFATDRTAEYMNWRYIEHPYFKYECSLFETASGPTYVVWRKETDASFDGAVGRVVEVIGKSNAIALALPGIHAQMKAHGVLFYDYYGTHDLTIAALMQGGMHQAITLKNFDVPRLFAPLAIDIRKTINVNLSMTKEHVGPWMYETGHWLVTKGDGNQDRPNL